MRMLAAGLAAVFAALLVGSITGVWPKARRLRPVGPPRGLWLVQAGVPLGWLPFWAAVAAFSLLSFLAVWSISGLLVVAVPAGLTALFVPRIWLMRRRAQRMVELQGAWPDALRDLVASISAGMSLGRAIETMGVGGPAPLREAFSRYPLLARSLGVVPALEVIKGELAHPASDRIIEVLIVAHERGGPIVLSILRDLAEATTKDMWAAEELATLALEQKINARAVFVIPWLVLAFITARPGPFREFYASAAGVVVVVIGGAASFLGMWVAARLGRDPEEPRVFGRVA
ncbi:MAG TPA: type II secretion system F family protein [Acidimicrobiia bacterium]|nr:type II secretion system F family protein [Acidimicrobiia bacterium]